MPCIRRPHTHTHYMLCRCFVARNCIDVTCALVHAVWNYILFSGIFGLHHIFCCNSRLWPVDAREKRSEKNALFPSVFGMAHLSFFHWPFRPRSTTVASSIDGLVKMQFNSTVSVDFWFKRFACVATPHAKNATEIRGTFIFFFCSEIRLWAFFSLYSICSNVHYVMPTKNPNKMGIFFALFSYYILAPRFVFHSRASPIVSLSCWNLACVPMSCGPQSSSLSPSSCAASFTFIK